jgi:hypothetical protein
LLTRDCASTLSQTIEWREEEIHVEHGWDNRNPGQERSVTSAQSIRRAQKKGDVAGARVVHVLRGRGE